MLVFQSVLRGRKPVVLVEELAYTGFRRGAELLRADVVSVAMDNDGLIPEALEAAARAHEAQVVCISPEIHNPTAGFMPLERREAIAKVARRCGLEILEDDCYRMSEAKATTFRKLASERTWYVGSISKWLTPALRLGYVIPPDGQAGLVRQTAETSYFGLATPMTDLFGKLLAHPDLLEMAKNVRLKTRTYVEMVVNILGGYNLAWHADGLFFWLELPQGWRTSAFCQAAAGQGVLLRAAEDYVGRGDPAPHAVRLAVNGGVGFKSYEAGILRLRDLLDNPPARMGV